MAMSRRHYVAIAGALRRARSKPDTTTALDSLTVELADMFEADNSNFDRDRFLDAAQEA